MKPMAYKLALFAFRVFFFLNLAPLQPIRASQKATCSYTLEVKTRNKFLHLVGKPGIKDPVHVRFRNKSGIEVFKKHLNEKTENTSFEPGNIDPFNLSGPCLEGKICLLDFMVDGTNEWRPDYANVRRENMEKPDTFHFQEKFPPKVWHGRNYCDDDDIAASGVSENYTFDNGQGNVRRNRKSPRRGH
ncbi:hypothetical protein SUGI_0461400 [Cryptomeria japonica]|uniref:uncharacterized protein LOC131056557 n=1 Tax=Cryptomeria japonica TaxID=3369 RepID=UPI002408AA4D|nr:uncharacterized protein LOC131056557 [Cryptomeria japonica]GLJ24193.1 hypothetical protein SUGI_0461400 [Cryptomeria japonica]